MGTAYAVVTAVGKDRVGIVDDLSAVVERARCNIEESRMAVLGGDFAIILLASGPESDAAQLILDGPGLGAGLGLHIEARLTTAPREQGAGRPYVLESVSLDAPGIVHAVTDLLRRRGVNIEDMDTETVAAPWTGAPMFRMRGRLVVPHNVPIVELRHELEALELERDLDITLKPAAASGAET